MIAPTLNELTESEIGIYKISATEARNIYILSARGGRNKIVLNKNH